MKSWRLSNSRLKDGTNPRDIKFLLCEEIVERFHDRAAADAARETFIARFRGGAMPEDIPEKTLDTGGEGIGIATGVDPMRSDVQQFRGLPDGSSRVVCGLMVRRSVIALQLEAGFDGILQVGKRKFCKANVI